MFPEFNINIVEVTEQNQEENKPLGKVPAFDFNTGQTIIQDGKPLLIDEKQAIKQWIEYLLKTELDKFKIFLNTGFGVTFIDLIGQKKLPQGFVNSEIKRQIEEKLKMNRRIKSIENFEINKINDLLEITFLVILVDNQVFESGVNFIV